MKACTSVVVPNSRIRMLMGPPIDEVPHRLADFAHGADLIWTPWISRKVRFQRVFEKKF